MLRRVEGAARFRRDLTVWGRANQRSFPWRETDDSFRILVAEMLLQRSRGKTVAKVYEKLFARWPDAASLARARVDTIEKVIRPLGLTRRAGALKEMATLVSDLGEVPSTLDGLLALPGVGPYAAGATLAVAFERRSPVVDGVTARVYRRYFGLNPEVPASLDPELWRVVSEASPARKNKEWNWAVLDLAATICLPKVPRCQACPLAAHCRWSQAHARSVTDSC
jgi:A/G-specific adenine glycosylase